MKKFNININCRQTENGITEKRLFEIIKNEIDILDKIYVERVN